MHSAEKSCLLRGGAGGPWDQGRLCPSPDLQEHFSEQREHRGRSTGVQGALLLTLHPCPVGVLHIFQSRHNVPVYLQEVTRSKCQRKGFGSVSAGFLSP